MKKLVIIPFLFLTIVSVAQKKDTVEKATIDVPLTAKTDTVKYSKVMYNDSQGFVKVDPATVILSGKGNNMLQGFWSKPPKVRIFVRGKEIKEEDFIQVLKQ